MSPTRELALQIAAEASKLVARLARPLEVQYVFLELIIPKTLKLSLQMVTLTQKHLLVPHLEALQRQVTSTSSETATQKYL